MTLMFPVALCRHTHSTVRTSPQYLRDTVYYVTLRVSDICLHTVGQETETEVSASQFFPKGSLQNSHVLESREAPDAG